MDFLNLIKEARTVRRFKQRDISLSTLETLVDCARYSPSAANRQCLKFCLIHEDKTKNIIFPLIKWAGALKEWDGPNEGERPVAYIVILLDKNISQTAGIDHGIAAQSMVLGARSLGLGCCIIGGYNKRLLKAELEIPESMESLLILAFGEASEDVIVEDHDVDKNISYYRDEQGSHHVPKRVKNKLIWKQL